MVKEATQSIAERVQSHRRAPGPWIAEPGEAMMHQYHGLAGNGQMRSYGIAQPSVGEL
jgi:hypothetical protein